MAVGTVCSAAEPVRPVASDKDLILKGDAKCTGCHDESDETAPTMLELHPSVLSIGKTKHGTKADGRTPTCINCHGESEAHLKFRGSGDRPLTEVDFRKNTKSSAEARNGSCLQCHQGANRIGWQMSQHANQDLACTSCHQVHTRKDKVLDKVTQTEVCFTCHKEQRAQVNKPSHHPIVEGKMACSSCHNVHGDNPKQLVKASTNETCFTCHMEKRGPFVHNHEPVSEDCSICHQPHGTVTPSLLKTRVPVLCQECHAQDSHVAQPMMLPNANTNSRGVLGTVARGCLNCHTNIHGGNSTVNSATAGRFRR
jgi:DmsE family decaheme c-type cytochrome